MRFWLPMLWAGRVLLCSFLNYIHMFKTNFPNTMGYYRSKAMAMVWFTYAECASHLQIVKVGYHAKTETAYIHVSNGIHICSKFAHPVLFHLQSKEKGWHKVFRTWGEASAYL